MLQAAWWTAGATIALAALGAATVIMAVLAYRSQNQQLRILRIQSGEQHAVNIRQIEVLDAQLAELREAPKVRARQADEWLRAEVSKAVEQKRAQAEQVFLQVDRLDQAPVVSQAQQAAEVASGPVIIARVRNASDQPVYDITLSWHRGSAPWGDFERRTSLLPGTEWSSTRAMPDDLPEYVDPHVFGAVVWFRDAAGHHWRRRPDGTLDGIPPGQPLP